MVKKSQSTTGNSVLVSVAAFVVVVAGLRAAQGIVVPILMAAFLAMISMPILHWFQRNGMPAWLALVGITVMVLVAGVAIVGVIASSVSDLRLQLPLYQEHLVMLQESLVDWLKQRGFDAGLSLDQELLDANRVISLFGNLLGALGSLLNNAMMIIFLLVFMQLEATDFPAKLLAIAPEGSDVSGRLERIHSSVWEYVRLKTRISLLTGALVAAWLWLLGVDFPLLWGLIAFLLNYVPNIGSIIAAVPAVVVAILQPNASGDPVSLSQSLSLAAYTTVGYIAINIVVGNILEPRWMGSGAGLSTFVVFLSLVFWGWVLGPVGMVLSVPLTMIVKIAFDNSRDMQWVAVLLGSDVPAESAK